MRTISELEGKTLISVTALDDAVIFNCDNGDIYKMYHAQDCCESVTIEDIVGDLNDLVGSPILKAEEVSNYEPSAAGDIEQTKEANRWGPCTWTFYKIATIKGYVDIRWFGESNGCYSESVDFIKIGEDDEW